ncbi:hypothetical protein HY571_01095 [Candidatus Micrarchaeota archaeon]|nr:hypothetical protein [Candidatus Micrarchaeota archaeon]
MEKGLTRRQFLGVSGSALLAACAPAIRRAPTKPVELPLPGNKRIKLLFSFGSHYTKKSAAEIKPLLSEFRPHVYVLETTGSEQEAIETEEEYRKGHFPIDDPEIGLPLLAFKQAEDKALMEAKVPRIFILERLTSQEQKEADEAADDFMTHEAKAFISFYSGNPMAAVSSYKRHLAAFNKLNLVREFRMRKVLSNFYNELVSRYPELARESEIRVVARYGSAHTSLYHFAKRRSGFSKVHRQFRSPHYFPLHEAELRRATLGLPPTTDHHELGKCFLVHVLYDHLRQKIEVGDSNIAAFSNTVLKRARFEDLEKVSRHIATYADPSNDEAIKGGFQQIGIKLPEIKEEIHAFLRRKRIPLAPD